LLRIFFDDKIYENRYVLVLNASQILRGCRLAHYVSNNNSNQMYDQNGVAIM